MSTTKHVSGFALVACDWNYSFEKPPTYNALGIVKSSQLEWEEFDIQLVYPHQVRDEERVKVPRSRIMVLEPNVDLANLYYDAPKFLLELVNRLHRRLNSVQKRRKLERQE
jgi:hypothetical protein